MIEFTKIPFFYMYRLSVPEKVLKKDIENFKMKILIYITSTQFCIAEFCCEKVEK